MKSWSLSKKIWSVLGLLVLCFVGNTIYTLRSVSSIKNNMTDIATVVKSDQLTSDIQDAQRLMVIVTYESILEQDAAKIAQLFVKFDEALKNLTTAQEDFSKIASPKGIELVSKYRKDFDVWLLEVRKAQKLVQAGQEKEAYAVLTAMAAHRKTMLTTLSELNDLTAKDFEDEKADSNEMASKSLSFGIIVSMISILISVSVAFGVLRALTRAINQIVSSLNENSSQVSSAATQIATSAESLSQCATEQAASLEETAASIEEMNSMVHKNSENATSTASTSAESKLKAEQGKLVVEKMIQSMDDINQSNNTIMHEVNESNDRISEIVKVIEEIGNKTKVINDIVFQTKLLSFNASVEAARAGEHGKGFAVVAEEVGTLAQMSGNAAKEISALLDGSIQKVNSIVTETRTKVERLIADGKQTVESGARVARQCGDVLEEIVTNVSSVSHMAGEIASASEEQSRGVTEITKAMTQLDQVTQQNATSSAEAASAAESLSNQAESLRTSVGQLVSLIDGGTEQSTVTRPMAKVMQLKPARKMTKTSSSPKLKVAVGDGSVPSHHDERFTDL